MLSLKDNQKTLHGEVEDYYEDLKNDGVLKDLKDSQMGLSSINDSYKDIGILITKDLDHGRYEKRTYYYSTDISWMVDAKKDWAKLTGIGMVERVVTENDEVSTETSYYIGSVDNVNDFSVAVRSHWGIESMHWSLDVTFRDDENRTREVNGAQNMGLIKRMAYNILNKESKVHPKVSKKRKRIIASGDTNYREVLLAI